VAGLRRSLYLYLAIYITILAVGFIGVSIVATIYRIGIQDALKILMISPFSDPFSASEILVRFTAIYTVALGVSIALKAGLWNVGGEGQFLVGAVMTLYIAKYLSTPSPAMTMTLMILGAVFFAMLWAAPPAILKARFGVNEIVTTLLLNIVASSFTLYALDGPIRGSGSFGYLISDVLPPSLRLPVLLKLPMISGGEVSWVDTRLSYAIVITLILAVILHILFERTPLDTHLGVIARDWRIASYAGIDVQRYVIGVMLLAGALAGLAGALHVMGVLYRFDSGQIDHGFGYLGVLAAALGRASIAGTALSSLFISFLVIGGEALQKATGATYAITWVAVGLMMFTTAVTEALRVRRP
jgi:ABC-type uncharacterized transport system permease subunit